MARTQSLYDAATGKGRVIRAGEVVQVVMDGAGAFVCNAQDFMLAQKWAQSRTASTNLITDRGRFIEKIEVLIARPASFVSTRGSQRPLEQLAKGMKQAGYDLGEWMLPPELMKMAKPKQPVAKTKAADADPAADPSQPDEKPV